MLNGFGCIALRLIDLCQLDLESQIVVGVPRHPHNDVMNALFCDGHVKGMTRGSTSPAMYSVQDDAVPSDWVQHPTSGY